MSATEEWRAIPRADGYEVSDQGRVRSHRMFRGDPGPRLLKPSVTRDGYLQVGVRFGGQWRRPTIHTLVLAAFVGPRPVGMETRHLDGDPTDNWLANLRYGTQSENTRDRRLHGVDPNLNKTHCPRSHPYDEANTYIGSKGDRNCRTCRRDAECRRVRHRARTG